MVVVVVVVVGVVVVVVLLLLVLLLLVYCRCCSYLVLLYPQLVRVALFHKQCQNSPPYHSNIEACCWEA